MPTTNPVPSSDPSDLVFNAEKLDQVVNSTAATFTDRLGVVRQTLSGLSAEFPNASSSAAAATAQAAIATAGAATATTQAGIATAAATAAEAARDAALFRAEAYGSVALALADAGLTVGQQFAALSEDLLTVGIYRKDAGPVAFGPIAIYPTSASVNANFNLTQSALFSIAANLIATQTIVTTHHAFEE